MLNYFLANRDNINVDIVCRKLKKSKKENF